MESFPAHPDAVTPAWVEAALRAAGMLGAERVESVAWRPIGTGQVGDSARFELTYDRPSDAPRSLAGKFPASDPTSRATAAALGLYAKEVRFYRELAPLLDVRVPRVLASGFDPQAGDFVLLFEDLGPARQGDQIAGCTLADARQAIAQAAALHGPSWRNPDMLEHEWLRPVPGLSERICDLYPQAQALFRDRYADSLEPEYMRLCEVLNEAAASWFGREQAAVSLVHGDFRLDNMLFDINDGGEPIAVLDWQTLGAGSPFTDLGYFLGCGIGPALSRAHEAELFALYLDTMARCGIALSRDEVWGDYRLGVLHGVSTAVFSAANVVRTPRGDANFLSMARGACDLALRHDSLGALMEIS